MLKHALRTAVELDRLPPEKRVSIAGVTLRRRSSVYNAQMIKKQLRRSSSLSWPNSRSSYDCDEVYCERAYSKMFKKYVHSTVHTLNFPPVDAFHLAYKSNIDHRLSRLFDLLFENAVSYQ